MANNLFNKIMGKVPVPAENPVEEALTEKEIQTEEPEVEENAKKTEESCKEENNEPQTCRDDVQELLDKMLGKTEAGSTKIFIKPEEGGNKEEKEPEEDKENKEITVSPSQVILIDLVLDNTISMKFYYKILYDKLFNLINGIHKVARKTGFNAEIYYGITYIRDAEPIIEESFLPNCFTKDVLQIMEKLKNITFSGGADNGRENINGAIRTSLQKLHNTDCENAKCGILLFTDSLPEEEEMSPDFMEYGDVRFAHCFVNDDRDYLPIFRPVDHDGKTDSRLVNVTEIKTLESFLNGGGDSITLELISEILEQVSVNGK